MLRVAFGLAECHLSTRRADLLERGTRFPELGGAPVARPNVREVASLRFRGKEFIEHDAAPLDLVNGQQLTGTLPILAGPTMAIGELFFQNLPPIQ